MLRMWSNKTDKKGKRGGAADTAMEAYLELADKVPPLSSHYYMTCTIVICFGLANVQKSLL